MGETVLVLLFAGAVFLIKGGLYRGWAQRDEGKPAGFRDPQNWAGTQFRLALVALALGLVGLLMCVLSEVV